MVGRNPVTRWLDRLVRARYLRIIPVEFRHTFYLRVEILGCRGGKEWNGTKCVVFTQVIPEQKKKSGHSLCTKTDQVSSLLP